MKASVQLKSIDLLSLLNDSFANSSLSISEYYNLYKNVIDANSNRLKSERTQVLLDNAIHKQLGGLEDDTVLYIASLMMDEDLIRGLALTSNKLFILIYKLLKYQFIISQSPFQKNVLDDIMRYNEIADSMSYIIVEVGQNWFESYEEEQMLYEKVASKGLIVHFSKELNCNLLRRLFKSCKNITIFYYFESRYDWDKDTKMAIFDLLINNIHLKRIWLDPFHVCILYVFNHSRYFWKFNLDEF